MSHPERDTSVHRTAAPDSKQQANALVHHEHPTSKAKEKRARKAEGQLAGLVKAATCLHAGDPHAQVNFLLARATIVAATGRKRVISDKRRSDLGDMFHQCIGELKPLGINLQGIADFSQKHFIALMRSWEAKGLEESTIQERVCLLRRMLSLMGKPQVVPLGAALRRLLQQHHIDAGTRGRAYIPTLPRGWRDKGIDVDAVFTSVAGIDAIGRALLQLMLHFGLRFNEALQLQPGMSRHDGHLFVWRGTKGGKQRSIGFSSDPVRRAVQEKVLDEAAFWAARHPKGELGWPGLSLEQSKNRMRTILRNVGITKRQLGVTVHGLRHQYATDLFEELTGMPAPVLQKLPYTAYQQEQEKVARAYLEISRRMGHERPSVTHCYGGSVHQLRNGERALKLLLEKLAGAGEAFRAAGVRRAWLAGTNAGAGRHDSGEHVLLVAAISPQDFRPDLVGRLSGELERVCGRPVGLFFLFDDRQAPDGTEIHWS